LIQLSNDIKILENYFDEDKVQHVIESNRILKIITKLQSICKHPIKHEYQNTITCLHCKKDLANEILS